MPLDFGGEDYTLAETAHGHDWPCLRQFCILLENRVGQLNDLLRQLECADTRVLGLMIMDSVDFAITRLVFSDTDRAREKLSLLGFHFTESDVLGAILPDDEKPFTAVCTALAKGEINIHHAYPLQLRRAGGRAVVMYVDDVDAGVNLLKQAGIQVLTENDLLHDDEFA